MQYQQFGIICLPIKPNYLRSFFGIMILFESSTAVVDTLYSMFLSLDSAKLSDSCCFAIFLPFNFSIAIIIIFFLKKETIYLVKQIFVEHYIKITIPRNSMFLSGLNVFRFCRYIGCLQHVGCSKCAHHGQ